MRCPKCNHAEYNPASPCPNCHFSGDPAQLEELAHIAWLLREIDAWDTDDSPQRIRQKYTARQNTLENLLNLRPLPLTTKETRQAWLGLSLYAASFQKLTEWGAANLIKPAVAQEMTARFQTQIEQLKARLREHPAPDPPPIDSDQAAAAHLIILLDTVQKLRERDGFTSATAENQIIAALAERKERLEHKLAARAAPPPEPEPLPTDAPITPPPEPAAPAPPPALPFRERLWRTILSERTLHALLLLGVFLLFAAALSFVFWGWRNFHPLLRVAIPTGFTLLFFALGWVVRTQTPLYRSGIALSAIAALLIPLDFYTLYVNLHIPERFRPEFWLISSIFCLFVYIAATLIIRSRLFGYLVGAAAGSAVLALIEIGNQITGLSRDWYTAGLSALTAAMIILATIIARRAAETKWHIFAAPLRNLALLSVGVIMPLTLGWRFISRDGYDALHYALTINWWLGGFIFGWGAVYYRSRSLGILAAAALPFSVYLAQSALFDHFGINAAWHACGLACLVSLYFTVGHRLLARRADPILRGHGRTAVAWGIALLIIAALWSLTDLTGAAAAACSHTILVGAVVLAARLWQRPRYLYAASLLSFTATTFTASELNLDIAQLSVAWASLAIAHIIIAVNYGNRCPPPTPNYARPLVIAGYTIAVLALFPTLLPYNRDLALYALGNWLGLAAWGALLAHRWHRGFVIGRTRRSALFHWATAAPLPVWIWMLLVDESPADLRLPLALTLLTCLMVEFSYHLARIKPVYRYPWYFTALAVSVTAPASAVFIRFDSRVSTICFFVIGLLYFTDALVGRHSIELASAALLTAAGYWHLFYRLDLSRDALCFAMSLLIAAYFLAGLWAERRKSGRGLQLTHRFLLPHYVVAHILSLTVLGAVYMHPGEWLLFGGCWTNEMRLWGAAVQLILGVIYGLYAWGTYRERWGHIAAWLGAAGGGFIVIAYSTGRGSSATWGALAATIFVLSERGMHWLKQRRKIKSRHRAYLRLAWRLYRQPLLVTGWTISAGAIVLALVRNLWLLGGGRPQQTWAAFGLLLITALYAASARLFRRARFVWLAAFLVFAPWTILTNLGGFTAYRLTPPGFAVSWIILAWVLFLISTLVERRAPRAYVLPLRVVMNLLLPFALLWCVADPPAARYAYGFAIALYGAAAWSDYRHIVGQVSIPAENGGYGKPPYAPRAAVLKNGGSVGQVSIPAENGDAVTKDSGYGKPPYAPRDAMLKNGGSVEQVSIPAENGDTVTESGGYGKPPYDFAQPPYALRVTKYLYPAFGLMPVWCVYLMAKLLPAVRHEHYGLMLLCFGPLGLAVGQWLQRAVTKLKDAHALPAYLTCYAVLIVSTMLTAHIAPLLALVLLFDAALMVVSARLFSNPLWVYPAAALAPFSLLIALNEAGVPANRQGWWLIGLATIYLTLAWALRRAKLTAYSSAALMVGFALIALGLPPSSRDKTGALWGYGGAALLYGTAAFWLRQPLLLTPACALAVVPYAMSLQKSLILPDFYGLALLPGAVVALTLGWWLDKRFGDWRDFPWLNPSRWLIAVADRLLSWWGLALYVLGFSLGIFSPFFTAARHDLAALNFLLFAALCAWAIYRFRLRIWLLAAALAVHLAAIYYLEALGWWRYPTHAWLWLTPLTVITALLGLVIERRQSEGAPLDAARLVEGWSRPLYVIVLAEMLIAQGMGASLTVEGAALTLVHALLIAVCATVWRSRWIPYISTALGTIALVQWVATFDGQIEGLPVVLSLLALAYGAGGYGMALFRRYAADEPELPPRLRLWELPLQNSSLALSFGILLLTLWLGIDLMTWTVRAMVGMPFREIVRAETVRMVVGVLSLLGLLYVAAAVVYRRLHLGYVAIGMLMTGWMLYAFYIRQWDELPRMQWYAFPAGAYLLAIAYLEWQRGNRTLARWLDYAAILLMMGSLFWQTLLFGWGYALSLGAEGFAAFWGGSARRLRRFFYAGIVGVILATLGQLINSLQSINQWIVFGIVGLSLVIVAVIVERKLEDIKAWQEILETWE